MTLRLPLGRLAAALAAAALLLGSVASAVGVGIGMPDDSGQRPTHQCLEEAHCAVPPTCLNSCSAPLDDYLTRVSWQSGGPPPTQVEPSLRPPAIAPQKPPPRLSLLS